MIHLRPYLAATLFALAAIALLLQWWMIAVGAGCAAWWAMDWRGV